MTFIDDFRGLSRAEQIARIQAVAQAHGDHLSDREAEQAVNLYATQAQGERRVACMTRATAAEPQEERDGSPDRKAWEAGE